MSSEGSRFAPATLVAGSTLAVLKESGSASLQFFHEGRIVVGGFLRHRQENGDYIGRAVINNVSHEATVKIRDSGPEIKIGKQIKSPIPIQYTGPSYGDHKIY